MLNFQGSVCAGTWDYLLIALFRWVNFPRKSRVSFKYKSTTAKEDMDEYYDALNSDGYCGCNDCNADDSELVKCCSSH